MTEEVFYKKVGRRYVPVSYYDSKLLEAVPAGCHLVVKQRGSEMRRYNVDPALAPMIAAGEYFKDQMSSAMLSASEARPATKALTEEQQVAWATLKKAYGTEMFYLQFPSANDIINAGITELSLKAEALLKHPSVRAAYEQFLMVAKLTAEGIKER